MGVGNFDGKPKLPVNNLLYVWFGEGDGNTVQLENEVGAGFTVSTAGGGIGDISLAGGGQNNKEKFLFHGTAGCSEQTEEVSLFHFGPEVRCEGAVFTELFSGEGDELGKNIWGNLRGAEWEGSEGHSKRYNFKIDATGVSESKLTLLPGYEPYIINQVYCSYNRFIGPWNDDDRKDVEPGEDLSRINIAIKGLNGKIFLDVGQNAKYEPHIQRNCKNDNGVSMVELVSHPKTTSTFLQTGSPILVGQGTQFIWLVVGLCVVLVLLVVGRRREKKSVVKKGPNPPELGPLMMLVGADEEAGVEYRKKLHSSSNS